MADKDKPAKDKPAKKKASAYDVQVQGETVRRFETEDEAETYIGRRSAPGGDLPNFQIVSVTDAE